MREELLQFRDQADIVGMLLFGGVSALICILALAVWLRWRLELYRLRHPKARKLRLIHDINKDLKP